MASDGAHGGGQPLHDNHPADRTILDTSNLRQFEVVIMPPKAQPKKQPTRHNDREPATEPPNPPSLKESLTIADQSQDARVSSVLESQTLGEPATDQPSQLQHLNPLNVSRTTLSGASSSAATGTQPAGLKFQPKNAARRSKEEREAQEKADEERRLARLAATSGTRGNQYLRGRAGRFARGEFRGGMSGWRSQIRGVGQATGPLSGGLTSDALGTRGCRGRGRPAASESLHVDTSSSISPTTTRVKKEPKAKAEKGKDTAAGEPKKSSGKSKDTNIKVEDTTALYVSSDGDEDEFEGQRINIEYINLISDDSEEDPVSTKGKEKYRSPKPPGWSLQPVRLDRHDHVERHVGVNTDTSLTRPRHKANETTDIGVASFLSHGEDKDGMKVQPKKVRSKGKDVEFVRDERRWKGVYQDEEDVGDHVKIKEEPKDEDVMILDALPTSIPTDQNLPATEQESLPQAAATVIDDGEQPVSPKIKRRQRSQFRATKPTLQTLEDRQEWERYEEDVQALNEELVDSDEDSALGSGAKDADGDTAMGEGKKNRRDGLVYLFQLPPILPRLVTANDLSKAEEDSSGSDETSSEENLKTSNPIKAEHAIKLEDDDNAAEKFPDAFMAEDEDDFVGYVGKMTVFESGYVSFDWGGIQHDVSKAAGGSMLQEVVVTDVSRIKREPGSGAEDDGQVVKTATSMGQLAGGFVVTPNWESLFAG